MIPTKEELFTLYTGAFNQCLRNDLQGWHADEPIFADVVRKAQPLTYIEDGSWKGASMTTVLNRAHFEGLDTKAYAVDFWQEPGLFDQFLHNMLAMALADRVTPIRGHSFDAYKALKAAGVKAQLLYIDADHTRNGALIDMVSYYQLLEPGGIMFGDDYTEEKGVGEAVKLFCDFLGIMPEVTTYYHWQLPPKK